MGGLFGLPAVICGAADTNPGSAPNVKASAQTLLSETMRRELIFIRCLSIKCAANFDHGYPDPAAIIHAVPTPGRVITHT